MSLTSQLRHRVFNLKYLLAKIVGSMESLPF